MLNSYPRRTAGWPGVSRALASIPTAKFRWTARSSTYVWFVCRSRDASADDLVRFNRRYHPWICRCRAWRRRPTSSRWYPWTYGSRARIWATSSAKRWLRRRSVAPETTRWLVAYTTASWAGSMRSASRPSVCGILREPRTASGENSETDTLHRNEMFTIFPFKISTSITLTICTLYFYTLNKIYNYYIIIILLHYIISSVFWMVLIIFKIWKTHLILQLRLRNLLFLNKCSLYLSTYI